MNRPESDDGCRGSGLLFLVVVQDIPGVFFQVYASVRFEKHPFLFQQKPLFRPMGCRTSLAVDDPVAGQGRGGLRQCLSCLAGVLRKSRQTGNLTVSQYPSGGNGFYDVADFLLKIFAVESVFI